MASTNLLEENESVAYTSVTIQESVQPSEEMPPVPDEDVSLRIPAILGLDVDSMLDQEFAFPFSDLASALDIQGSARSDQGAQGTSSLPSSSEQLTTRAVSSGGVQPPNNLVGQNPPRHLFSDPYDYELEKLRIEKECLKRSFEETTSELMAELERKMAEARSDYEREFRQLDAAQNAKAMEEDVNRSFVEASSLLASAFVSKCSERKDSSDLAIIRAISQQVLQQQQAVQTSTHVNSTAPGSSGTAAESQILNPSDPPQPRPISQQAAVQASTHMSSTAPSRPSVTAAEAPIPNPSGPLSHSPSFTTTQPTRPLSQQPAVQANTHATSTAPPPPSVTAAEPPVTTPLVPLARFSHRHAFQPRPMSQQPVVQSHTHMNSTAPPPPSVTAVETPTPNHLRHLARFPPHTTTQQKPISQPVTSTALRRTSFTPEALAMHSPRTDTPRPRPPPVISNLTASSSTAASSPPVHGRMRAPAPHLKQFRPSAAPISAATTHPTRLVQDQPQHTTTITHPTRSVQGQQQPQHATTHPTRSVQGQQQPQHATTTQPTKSVQGQHQPQKATTTHPIRLVQGQQEQQQGNSKDGLVYLSDNDE